MNKARKGSAFERWLCVELSKWWTNGARTDVFWRTSGSGARATTRGKRGSKTSNSHGDIMALDPNGQQFLDVFTVEIKRGYNRSTIADLLDKPQGAAVQQYEKWIEQAIVAQQAAGSLYWLLIVKRDQREPIIFLPGSSWSDLVHRETRQQPFPLMYFTISWKWKRYQIAGMTLASFLKYLQPQLVKQLAKDT